MAAEAGAPRRGGGLPRDPVPPPHLRLRQHLRQDDPRLAARLHHRRRPPRRDGPRHGPRRVEHLPDAGLAPRGGQARREHPRLDARPLREGPARQARDARWLLDLQVRRDLRPRHGPVVDLRPLLDPRRRSPPRQPRLRRGGAVRQAPDRAGEAGGPPDDARPRHGDPRGRHHGQLRRCSAMPRWATRSRCCRRSGSPCGSGSPPCSSAAWRSPWRRSSAAPARRASPLSPCSSSGSPTVSTSVVRSCS